MEIDESRFKSAVRRNLAETSNAILKRRALIGLHSAHSAHSLDFFQIAAHALYNDIVAHAMRVLDHSSQSASFWYVVRCNESLAKAIAAEHSISLEKLSDLTTRFKEIRDQTHFHIDRDAVLNPKAVWDDAEITRDELGWTLSSVFVILSEIHFRRTGERQEIPPYDGSDAAKIIRSYKQCYPDVPIAV